MEKKATPTLAARFYRSDVGGEPVRDWLKALPVAERKIIGEDIKTVQFGWPSLGDGGSYSEDPC